MLSRAGRYARNSLAAVGFATVGSVYLVTTAQKVSLHVEMRCAIMWCAGCPCYGAPRVQTNVADAGMMRMQRMRKDATTLPDQFVLELGERRWALCACCASLPLQALKLQALKATRQVGSHDLVCLCRPGDSRAGGDCPLRPASVAWPGTKKAGGACDFLDDNCWNSSIWVLMQELVAAYKALSKVANRNCESCMLQVRKVVRALNEAADDKRVLGLVAYVGSSTASAGLAVTQELRAAVQDFRQDACRQAA